MARDFTTIKTVDGHEFEAILVGGVYRLLATTPSPSIRAPRFGDANPLIDRKDWRETERPRPEIPILNQGSHSSCFPPGTRVRMADGTERPIETVRLLDEVLTAEGNVGRVRQLMVRDADSLVRLTLYGHSHLRMTGEHPVLTRRGYVAAKELEIGDWVAMPRYVPGRTSFIQTAEHVPLTRWTVRQERRVRYAGVAGRAAATITKTPLPDVIHLTPETGRIFGLFLAEGNTDAAKVVWTFNINETETLVAELVGLLKSEWGVEGHIQPKPANGSIKVVVYGNVWARLFESLCSTGSGSKRLHRDLTDAPREFLEAMFRGWMDGDGFERRNSTSGVTISRDLALGMFDIAQALGYRPAIRRVEPVMNKWAASRRPRWEVECGNGGKDTYRCEMDETHVWRRVRGVVEEDYSGPVFNMSVEGDESYVAEGIGVHNCTGHGTDTALMTARAIAGCQFVLLSPTFIYANINGGRDAGSDPADAADLLRNVGTCLMSECGEDTIYQRNIPDSAYQTARRFTVPADAIYQCHTFDEIVTAWILGYTIFDTVRCGWNFTNLSDEFVPPVARGVGNHCIASGDELVQLRDGRWGLDHRNSWDVIFGNRGHMTLVEDHFADQPYMQAYAIKCPNLDPMDPTNPPK